jgi:hypothetical protein
MSYFHEYFLWDASHNKKRVPAAYRGNKTLHAYSAPFNLMHYKPARWWAAGDLDWLAEELDSSRHFPVAPKSAIKKLRKVSDVEIKSAHLEQWKKN